MAGRSARPPHAGPRSRAEVPYAHHTLAVIERHGIVVEIGVPRIRSDQEDDPAVYRAIDGRPVVVHDDVVADGDEVAQVPVAALLAGEPHADVVCFQIVAVEDAHACVIDPDGRDARAPDDVVTRRGMDGPVFIQDPVAAVVIDLAVLDHQVFHRAVGAKAVAFGAFHVPAGIVQVAVPHLDVTVLIRRIPVS